MSCANCYPRAKGEEQIVKTCSCCKKATYCSVSCQTAHWPRHKPNCLPPDTPVCQLFNFCFEDIFPATTNPIWWQFGFASISEYHGTVVSSGGLGSLSILLGLYQAIRYDISFAEDHHDGQPPRNTIGMSKKKLQKAYMTNTLDELIQRYIRNCMSNYGNTVCGYFSMWLQTKLIIGPTRPTTNNVEEWQKIKEEARRNIYTKYYGK